MGVILLALTALAGAAVWLGLHRPFLPGNRAVYSPRRAPAFSDSPLRGKRILFLGSSVTAGMTGRGASFADYLARQDGCLAEKAAVSASTLADRGPHSYLKRLRRRAKAGRPVDCLVCQLSTNDATFRSRLGEVSDSFRPEDLDTDTAAGGIEAVIALARDTWHCPVVFLTGTRYDSPRYHRLVNLLLDAAEKWDVPVIDLWHDSAMNAVSPADYRLYMADGVHPTRAGYLLWWTPAIRRQLCRILAPGAPVPGAPAAPQTGPAARRP